MLIVLVLSLLISLAVLQTGQMGYVRDQTTTRTEVLRSEAQKYEVFYNASRYYVRHNPANVGKVEWETIMESPTTAPAQREITLPEDWHIMQNKDEFDICAYLRPSAIAFAKNYSYGTSCPPITEEHREL